MTSRSAAAGFSLSLSDGLWCWTTFWPDGHARASGAAATRALAAAGIVRDICQACAVTRGEAA